MNTIPTRDDTDDKVDVQITCGTDTTPTLYLDSPTADNVGEWTYYVITYDGSTGKLYRNGTLVDTKTTTKGDIKVTATSFRIGTAQYNWNGLIDDVRIYNRALSAAEINALYNATQ